jgi:hypothetical protein
MKTLRIPCFFVLLTSISVFGLAARLDAQQRTEQRLQQAERGHALRESRPLNSPGGGIKEVVPAKYKERYREWKEDFLDTETGRSQWESYDQNKQFTLTITVSCDDRNGAETGKYKWNDAGELVAATIKLGCRIDEGYPNPIYYPVMNALSQRDASFITNRHILAAAKIAHEFGHIKQVMSVDGAFYRLQNQLMPVYNNILLANGRNPRDPKLVELSRQMGGTPVEIWEDREYWGEANAMLYLRDRITKESEQTALFSRIIRTVEVYAKDYRGRFDQIAQ